jgi:hypothetical protein
MMITASEMMSEKTCARPRDTNGFLHGVAQGFVCATVPLHVAVIIRQFGALSPLLLLFTTTATTVWAKCVQYQLTV